MGDSNNSLPTDPSSDSNGEGVLASVRQQINSMTGGASVTDIQQNFTTAAGGKAAVLKETVVENVMPAAGEALQSAQQSLQTLASKAIPESDSQGENDTKSAHPDHRIIDQMSDEQICDFLRDKHKSTALTHSKHQN